MQRRNVEYITAESRIADWAYCITYGVVAEYKKAGKKFRKKEKKGLPSHANIAIQSAFENGFQEVL